MKNYKKKINSFDMDEFRYNEYINDISNIEQQFAFGGIPMKMKGPREYETEWAINRDKAIYEAEKTARPYKIASDIAFELANKVSQYGINNPAVNTAGTTRGKIGNIAKNFTGIADNLKNTGNIDIAQLINSVDINSLMQVIGQKKKPALNENYTNSINTDYNMLNSDFLDPSKNLVNNLNTDYMASGGFAGNVPIEAEGEELIETPDGNIGEISGPDHEQGGVKMNVPEGSKIYSKRVKGPDGKTMAKRKEFREKYLEKLRKLVELHPKDKILKKTLEKTTLDFEKQDKEDMEYMQMLQQQKQQQDLYSMMQPQQNEIPINNTQEMSPEILQMLQQQMQGLNPEQQFAVGGIAGVSNKPDDPKKKENSANESTTEDIGSGIVYDDFRPVRFYTVKNKDEKVTRKEAINAFFKGVNGFKSRINKEILEDWKKLGDKYPSKDFQKKLAHYAFDLLLGTGVVNKYQALGMVQNIMAETGFNYGHTKSHFESGFKNSGFYSYISDRRDDYLKYYKEYKKNYGIKDGEDVIDFFIYNTLYPILENVKGGETSFNQFLKNTEGIYNPKITALSFGYNYERHNRTKGVAENRNNAYNTTIGFFKGPEYQNLFSEEDIELAEKIDISKDDVFKLNTKVNQKAINKSLQSYIDKDIERTKGLKINNNNNNNVSNKDNISNLLKTNSDNFYLSEIHPSAKITPISNNTVNIPDLKLSVAEALKLPNINNTNTINNKNSNVSSQNNFASTNTNINTNLNQTLNGLESILKDNSLTTGDLLGLYGTYKASTDPLDITNKQRSLDRPNPNHFANYGLAGLDKMENTKRTLNGILDNSLANNQLISNASRANNNANSTSINTARALNLATDEQQRQSDSKAYLNYSQQIDGINTKIAGMLDNRDAKVMEGERQAYENDLKDRDAYFTNLQRDTATRNKGYQQMGKMLNDIRERDFNNNVINQYTRFRIGSDGILRSNPKVKDYNQEEKYQLGLGLSKAQLDKINSLVGENKIMFDPKTNGYYNLETGKEVDLDGNDKQQGRSITTDIMKKNKLLADSYRKNFENDFKNLFSVSNLSELPFTDKQIIDIVDYLNQQNPEKPSIIIGDKVINYGAFNPNESLRKQQIEKAKQNSTVYLNNEGKLQQGIQPNSSEHTVEYKPKEVINTINLEDSDAQDMMDLNTYVVNFNDLVNINGDKTFNAKPTRIALNKEALKKSLMILFNSDIKGFLEKTGQTIDNINIDLDNENVREFFSRKLGSGYILDKQDLLLYLAYFNNKDKTKIQEALGEKYANRLKNQQPQPTT